jgi:hypothetical protein
MKIRIAQLSPLYALGLTLCVAGQAAADDPAYPQCDSEAQCGTLGTAAYKKGDYARAKDYFEQQVGQYEQSGRECARAQQTCRSIAAPYNNMALTLLKSGKPLQAQAWLDVAPQDSITDHNKEMVKRSLKDWKWPDSPEGEYWQYSGYGSWSTVTVSRDKDQWSIHYDGLRFPGAGMTSGPNMGDFDTDMPLAAKKAVYSEDKGCTVTITFLPDSVTLDEDSSKGECDGFGYGVSANGTFQRVSTSATTTK